MSFYNVPLSNSPKMKEDLLDLMIKRRVEPEKDNDQKEQDNGDKTDGANETKTICMAGL